MKLYHYDHCPYCVKARMIFGLKNIPFELITLLNDDVDTPTSLIGAKMVPILVRDDGTAMGESMDIVRLVDSLDDMPILVGEDSPKLAEWAMNAKDYLYPLTMPRWAKAKLEEFATQNAVDYFTVKKEAMIGPFENALAASDTYIAQANAHLKQLNALMHSKESVNTHLSEDDIHIFAMLRSLSIVKGLEYPDKVDAYRITMAERCNVPLWDNVAI